MRQYERNGVTVDQCTECRGIFLDRGELERLTTAENEYYSGGAAPTAPTGGYPNAGPPPAMPRRHYGSPDSPDSPNRWQPYPGQHPQQGYRRRRKRSFLEDLFD